MQGAKSARFIMRSQRSDAKCRRQESAAGGCRHLTAGCTAACPALRLHLQLQASLKHSDRGMSDPYAPQKLKN